MNKIIIIIGLIFISLTGYTQNIEKENKKEPIIIQVSDIELPHYKLDEISYKELISRETNDIIEAYPIDCQEKNFVYSKVHPMIGALHYSFAHHRPITISPDMIWLMILQGLSKHIHYNSESIKSKIYNLYDVSEIIVRRDDFIKGSINNKWNEVFPVFTEEISKKTKTDIHKLFLNKFTTTSENTEITYSITMMEAVEDYFDYGMFTLCGIPYIVLEGTPEDWKWIKDNLSELKKYELNFWIEGLQPVIDKIYETSKGNIDTEFWKSIYKWNQESGGNRVTGWIIKFFPYLVTYEDKKIVNPYLKDDILFIEDKERFQYGLTGDVFTSGVNTCDFRWKYFKKEFDMNFNAGFIGISQDEDKVLRPEINWFITQKSNKEKAIKTDTNSIVKIIKQDDGTSIEVIEITDTGEEDESEFENSGYDTEIERITACSYITDTLFYEICSDPDVFPIYKPDKNKTFEEGWADFEEYLKKPAYGINEKGKVKFSFLISSEGKAFKFRAISGEDKILRIMRSRIGGYRNYWSPGKKNGKIVLVKLIVEIELK